MKFFATVLFCASCEIPDTTPIPRENACQEQAVAWCHRLGEDGVTGCLIVYRNWCGFGGEVTQGAQDACLDAIRDETPNPLTGWYIPDACGATFAIPPPS